MVALRPLTGPIRPCGLWSASGSPADPPRTDGRSADGAEVYVTRRRMSALLTGLGSSRDGAAERPGARPRGRSRPARRRPGPRCRGSRHRLRAGLRTRAGRAACPRGWGGWRRRARLGAWAPDARGGPTARAGRAGLAGRGRGRSWRAAGVPCGSAFGRRRRGALASREAAARSVGGLAARPVRGARLPRARGLAPGACALRRWGRVRGSEPRTSDGRSSLIEVTSSRTAPGRRDSGRASAGYIDADDARRHGLIIPQAETRRARLRKYVRTCRPGRPRRPDSAPWTTACQRSLTSKNIAPILGCVCLSSGRAPSGLRPLC